MTTSEPGTVQARCGSITSERALEQSPEESRRTRRQVGASGWLPRQQQPRGASRQLRSKKGGTASVDASRPFSRWIIGGLRPDLASASRSTKEAKMPDRSTGTDGAPAKAPYLR